VRSATTLKILLSLCLSIVAAYGGGVTPVRLTAGADPRENITKATKALLEAKSFRAKMVYSVSTGYKGLAMLEFAAPDRYHFITESNFFSKDVNVKQEIIALGGETYYRGISGQWQKLQVDVRREISKLRSPLPAGGMAQVTDVKFIGDEVLNGTRMLVYQYRFDDTSYAEFKGVTKIWVGAKDGLPHRIEANGEAPNQGEAAKANWANTYYDYNVDIKIGPPM